MDVQHGTDSVILDLPSSQPKQYGDVILDGNARAQLGDTYNITYASEETKYRELRRALAYENMYARRAQLATMAPAYLEWIWSPEDDTGFIEWLRKQDTSTIYWVSGKPASGKSTLVKYLADHEKVKHLLVQSSHKSWQILHFFFDFRAAHSTSNHIEGLLRTILLQLMDCDQQLAEL